MHKGMKSRHWFETLQMAKELNKAGTDVIFLPEHDNMMSADAITFFNGKYVLADFKYSASTNAHTIFKNLLKGFKQANTIVIKLSKADIGTLRDAIDELKRKDHFIGNLKVINRFGKSKDVKSGKIKNNDYAKLLKGFL